jgi:hypothetical protein
MVKPVKKKTVKKAKSVKKNTRKKTSCPAQGKPTPHGLSHGSWTGPDGNTIFLP